MKLTKLFNETPVFLAPMAGVTDAPFRNTVLKFGATAVVSEMISSEALVRNNLKTRKRLTNDSEVKIIQIVGADPNKMAECAKINQDCGADIIDINMGCPVKKIINSDAGSALMKNEKLAVSIAEAVVKAVKIPVTLKMRLGWDNEHKNYLHLAKLFEEVGIRMLAIHCRTRSQMYSGIANWSELSKLKEIIKIPYLCNGDIKTLDNTYQALNESKANGIMIGRGALGKPWILKQMLQYLSKQPISPSPNIEEQYKIVMEHFHETCEFYGLLYGIRIFRKHFCWYSSGLPGSATFREKINKMQNINEIKKLIKLFYTNLQ